MSKLLLISNLLLGEKTVRASVLSSDSFLADSLADSGRNSGETQWACLRHAHALARSEPLSSILVRRRRLELPFPCGSYHLKVVRLPVSPPAHRSSDISRTLVLYTKISFFFKQNKKYPCIRIQGYHPINLIHFQRYYNLENNS